MYTQQAGPPRRTQSTAEFAQEELRLWIVNIEHQTGAATARSGISAALTRIAVRAPENNQARMDNFAHIIGLSLGVSLCATALANLAGLSLGAALAVYDFPGRRGLVVFPPLEVPWAHRRAARWLL